ncbi:MAG: glycyl-radical enzyme activating protein [Butyricicoccus sp.]
MNQGTVLRIEKISPNDGRGLRTVVFLKGCPLHCAWCSTPESQSPRPELFYKQSKCRHCARCIQQCPQKALSVSADRRSVVRDTSKCIRCFRCVDVCPTQAMGLYGETMTVEQVMKEIRKESVFYFFSQGGVTLSGGDILLQADFARAILRECKEDCLHTMAEMDLFGPYENVRKVLEYLDSYYVDVKCMDAELHQTWTGVSNQTILRNLRQAVSEFPNTPLHVRVPLIPGVNNTAENLTATIRLCCELPSCVELELLPYHRLGTATYGYLSRPYPMNEVPQMTADEAVSQLRFLPLEELPFTVSVSGKVLHQGQKEVR